MEKLKRREPIHFYTQLTLFEDELADHGCAQLTVRLRVMPSTFFLLQRFYLRIDNVLVRIIDTRLFGETNTPYLLRESTRREINVADMAPADHEHILDPNALWSHLPVIEHRCTKLICVDDDS
jgi:type 2A phosphatase activator TIP41